MEIESTMSGQWLGPIEGQPGGFVVLDLERHGDRCSGTVLLVPDDADLAHTGALLEFSAAASQIELQVDVFPLHPTERRALSSVEYGEHYPGSEHPSTALITLNRQAERLVVTYQTSVSAGGGAHRGRRSP